MILPLCVLSVAAEAPIPPVAGLTWHEVEVESTLDGAAQPIIVGVPGGYVPGRPTPLLVALHTWSSDYRQQPADYGPQAAERGWLLVLPHFRGPNLTPNPKATEAGGSIAAQHDIIDAVNHMKREYAVDSDRVYISGASGGGHMALLMAGKYPDMWAAVCSWCPVTDLRAWHSVGNSYAQHVEAVCGGPPGASDTVDFEYLRRSPRTFMTNAAHTHILFAHGDRDHTIPTDQSWETFSRLRAVPRHRTVFRSWCGGHEGFAGDGLDWATDKVRDRSAPSDLNIVTDEAKWYHWLFVAPAGPLALGRATAAVGEASVLLTTADCSRVAVNLRGLGVEVETVAALDGSPAPAGSAVFDSGTVTLLPPDAAEHEWLLGAE